MAEPMQFVGVRLEPEQVAEINEVTALVGGTLSQFVRMAVDDRLARFRPVVRAWEEDDHPDNNPSLPALSTVGKYEGVQNGDD